MSTQDNDSKPAGAAKEVLYRVFDQNQRGKEGRLHDIIVGLTDDDPPEPIIKTYTLFSEASGRDGTPMPQAHAYKFLVDPAFKVLAPNGKVVAPVNKFDPSKPLSELKDDEIVVKYEELSREALMKRARLIAGGESLPDNSTVQELAAFLVKDRKSRHAITEAQMDVQGKLSAAGDSMNEEDLEKLFGSRRAA